MIFAFLTIHPLALGTDGLPFGVYDKTRYIHACGSDGFVRLDGRCGRRRHLEHIRLHMTRLRKIRKYAGAEIHVGEIRKSRAIAAYATILKDDGIHLMELPKEAICP